MRQLNVGRPEPETKLPAPRTKTKQVNAPKFDVRTMLYQLTGTDLTAIHGLGPSISQSLVAECGTDLSKWPTEKHFTSWLCLSPGCKISGGKVLSAHTRKSSSRLASQLRRVAVYVGRTETALSAFYLRLAARIGKAKAVTPPSRASSRSSSTVRCASACSTKTQGPTNTSNGTVSASSSNSSDALRASASRCNQSRKVFLRKAAAYFAKQSG